MNTERILYLETSELDVEKVSTGADQQTTLRYPRAGYPNAKSELKLVEFRIGEDGRPVDIVQKTLGGIKEQFPWMEYIVRFGWLPDGQW